MEIKIQKANFAYNKKNDLNLNEINLKLSDSKIIGIIGNNGSGKSTLLKLIAGRILPNKGKAFIGDTVLSRKNNLEDVEIIKKIVGYLPQFLDDNLSSNNVKKEILATLEDKNVNLNDIDNRLKEIFGVLRLDKDCLEEPVYMLSNGERRKVAIASILIYNPSIIVLDEPTIGLDYASKKSLINYLIKLKKLQSKTIVIASNDIDFINKISDDIIVLKSGNVIKLENKNEIFRDVKFFEEHDIAIPKIIEFEDLVLKAKGIRLGYRNDINDLVKDILRKL